MPLDVYQRKKKLSNDNRLLGCSLHHLPIDRSLTLLLLKTISKVDNRLVPLFNDHFINMFDLFAQARYNSLLLLLLFLSLFLLINFILALSQRVLRISYAYVLVVIITISVSLFGLSPLFHNRYFFDISD